MFLSLIRYLRTLYSDFPVVFSLQPQGPVSYMNLNYYYTGGKITKLGAWKIPILLSPPLLSFHPSEKRLKFSKSPTSK